ncbi:insulinase family protein [Candidatus Poribacteria bacterium]|nr:insulinase family protein [Candidatus Poribacteria bacterium]MYB00980.1 insulinase family protein [Candidatus Poribacteria bacterium]
MKRIRYLLILFFVALTGIASAQDLADRVVEHVFPNGLKLLMIKRDTSPTIAPYLLFKAGSVDESDDTRGIAHMLEHMLFKGTKTIGTKDYEKEKVVLAEIDRVGDALDMERAKGARADADKIAELEAALKEQQELAKEWIVTGEYTEIYTQHGSTGFNAGTSVDYTIYTVELPSNKLELWAMLESDRLKNAVLREFYVEREAVKEERRMRVDTSPGGKLYEQFIAAAFTAHPYGMPIIGWPSDIAMLNRRKAEEFFKIHYAPNNSVMVIVGNIDIDKTVALIDKYFGDMQAQPLPSEVTTKELSQEGERRIEVEYDAEPQLMIGYHKPTVPHFDDYVLDMISAILSDGRTSRFYKNIVEEGIAVSANSINGYPGARYDNLFVVNGTPRSPHTTVDVEEAIYAELERLKTEPVAEKEFKRILKQIDAGFIRNLSSNAGMAQQLAFYEGIAGDWRYILGWRENMYKITPEDIMKVANTYFTKSNRTVGTLVKKAAAAPAGENTEGNE